MKNTTEKFHKKVYQIPDRGKTEARSCEAEARQSQLKKTASRPPSTFLEDSIPAASIHVFRAPLKYRKS